MFWCSSPGSAYTPIGTCAIYGREVGTSNTATARRAPLSSARAKESVRTRAERIGQDMVTRACRGFTTNPSLADDLRPVLDALCSVAEPGDHLVIAHWAHLPHDAFRSGPMMHEEVRRDSFRRGATAIVGHADTDFRLDVYEAPE